MKKLFAGLLAWLVLVVIQATPAAAEPMFLSYRAHVQNIGWQAWRNQPSAAGTSRQSLRLEAIELRGGIGQVSAHVQDRGWLAEVGGGQTAGTTGRGLRLEAIRVRSDVPGWRIECRAHVQDIGWMPWVGDGQTCGTTGRSLRMEAVQLRLVSVAPTAPGTPAR